MGASPGITDAVLGAWRNGWLDGFSVFGNSDHLERVRAALQAEPRLPVRLAAHLNLTVGPCLTGHPELTGPDGQLKLHFLPLLRRGWRRSRLQEACLAEWRAQLARLREFVAPREVTVLDSHLHVHMIPWLFEAICELAQEAGVSEVRLVREPIYLAGPPSRAWFVNLCKQAIMAVCLPSDLRVLRRSGLRHPEAMLGLLYGGAMSAANIRAGLTAVRARGYRSVEVLGHLGRAQAGELTWNWDAIGRAFCLSPARDAELAAFGSLHAAS